MTTEHADASALVPLPQTPHMAVTLFGTDDPVAVVDKASRIATALAGVIKKQGLTSRINQREYVRVEGWTMLGSMLGVFPVCAWTRAVEGGWEARVEARTLAGAIVGAAEAQCLREERNWSNRDDFALRSMAQTRATAKALRLPLGFVVAMAGFEATPAEEMVKDEEPAAPHGICPDHGVPYFQSGKMRSPAHKLDNGDWCNKPDDLGWNPPPTPPAASAAASAATQAGFGTKMPASHVAAPHGVCELHQKPWSQTKTGQFGHYFTPNPPRGDGKGEWCPRRTPAPSLEQQAADVAAARNTDEAWTDLGPGMTMKPKDGA